MHLTKKELELIKYFCDNGIDVNEKYYKDMLKTLIRLNCKIVYELNIKDKNEN